MTEAVGSMFEWEDLPVNQEVSTTKALSFIEFTDTAEEQPAAPQDSARDRLQESLAQSLFKAEGGYSTDRADTGNYYKGEFIGTNHGISAPVLATYLGRAPTVEDMKGLTQETARDIAFKNYYDRFNIEALPEELQEIVFHGVYLGESRAVKAMQSLLGVSVDGAVGPQTTEAMRNATFTKEEFRDAFLEQLRKTKTWDEHGKGWTNRFNELAK